MRYLVTRMDALHDFTDPNYHNRRQIRNSNIWPAVVEADSANEAVRVVYDVMFGRDQKLPTGRQFLVVPLDNPKGTHFAYSVSRAIVVSQIPVEQFEYKMRSF